MRFLVAHRERNSKDEAGLFCFRVCFFCNNGSKDQHRLLAAPSASLFGLFNAWVEILKARSISRSGFVYAQWRAASPIIFLGVIQTVRLCKLIHIWRVLREF